MIEATLRSEIVEEKQELNELQRARANLKKPKPSETIAAVKESENALLLRLITEGKQKLKKTVQVKREYEADISAHGLLMAQIRNGIHLKKVERKAEAQVAKAEEKVVEAQEKVVEVKQEEEDTSMFGNALHMLGFGEHGPQTRARTKRKSAKKATRKRVSAKKARSNKVASKKTTKASLIKEIMKIRDKGVYGSMKTTILDEYRKKISSFTNWQLEDELTSLKARIAKREEEAKRFA
jgi:hypothetical protein